MPSAAFTEAEILSQLDRYASSFNFPMLAKVLVPGEPSHYKPTKAPNTHGSNWPAGGTL